MQQKIANMTEEQIKKQKELVFKELAEFVNQCNVFVNVASTKGHLSQLTKLILLRKFTERFIKACIENNKNQANIEQLVQESEDITDEIFSKSTLKSGTLKKK